MGSSFFFFLSATAFYLGLFFVYVVANLSSQFISNSSSAASSRVAACVTTGYMDPAAGPSHLVVVHHGINHHGEVYGVLIDVAGYGAVWRLKPVDAPLTDTCLDRGLTLMPTSVLPCRGNTRMRSC